VIAVLRWFSRGCPLLLAAALSFGSPVGAADLMEDVDYRVIPRQKLTDSERIEPAFGHDVGPQSLEDMLSVAMADHRSFFCT